MPPGPIVAFFQNKPQRLGVVVGVEQGADVICLAEHVVKSTTSFPARMVANRSVPRTPRDIVERSIADGTASHQTRMKPIAVKNS
jgi:hypothetical protein